MLILLDLLSAVEFHKNTLIDGDDGLSVECFTSFYLFCEAKSEASKAPQKFASTIQRKAAAIAKESYVKLFYLIPA